MLTDFKLKKSMKRDNSPFCYLFFCHNAQTNGIKWKLIVRKFKKRVDIWAKIYYNNKELNKI